MHSIMAKPRIVTFGENLSQPKVPQIYFGARYDYKNFVGVSNVSSFLLLNAIDSSTEGLSRVENKDELWKKRFPCENNPQIVVFFS